ncbi:MAG: IS3 family transposase [Candidatus Krumholzibacteriia bacterium]
MSSPKYTQEFKDEAVRQVTERNYPAKEVAERLGIALNTLYIWIRKARPAQAEADALAAQKKEIQRLKAELKRTQEERDILKKGRRVLCKGPRVKYAFIRDHRHEHRLAVLCRVLRVHRSGYYAWLKKPESDRVVEDDRLLAKIKRFHQESGGAYGSPRIFKDLRDDGEACGRHRVARVMKQAKVKAIRSYKKPRYVAGKPSLLAPNVLDREFDVAAPNEVWVTDITYIRTWVGFVYLAVVMDLYSRKIVGWSMKTSLGRELVIDALLMAVWRRRPKTRVLVHSDQGSQYGSFDCRKFLEAHNLRPSMSRRGNCWDNAVAESFFSSLKKERIRRRVYHKVSDAKSDVFDYIEMFYNPRRRHSHLGDVSPEAFECASAIG